MTTQLKDGIQRLLRPSERLISRLWYTQKFVLIGLVMVIPLAFVTVAYVGVEASNGSFASSEQVGVVYVRPVTGLLESVVAARTAAVEVAAHRAPASALTGARARVAAAIAAVDAVHAQGATLGLNRQWATVSAQVRAAVDAPVSTPARVAAAFTTVTGAIESLIAADGNNSNMILDPDNDSYYVMDAVLNRIPALIDDVGQAADLQTGFALAGGLTLDRQLALEDLRGSIAVNLTGNADPDYAAALHNTHDRAMAGRLSGPLAAFNRAVEAVSAQLSTAEHRGFAPGDAARLSAAARSAGAALDAASLPVIVHLLAVRTGGFSAATFQTIVIVLIGILFAAYLFAGFYQSVRRSQLTIRGGLWELQEYCMTPLADALDAMADGDLTRQIEITAAPIEELTRDELNCIVKGSNVIRERIIRAVASFNATNEKLRAMIGQVSASANSVGSASRDMSSSSQETGRATGEIALAIGGVASGAERQVAMLAQARGSAREVVAATDESARDAVVTGEAADEVRRAVADGAAAAAAEANEAMRAVRDSSAAVNEAIDGLVAKSTQIGAIVDTITGIAEQTNLLALNAAIEAARAGEEGKGFAVVAEEVRRLAEDSQRAAAEISTLIAAIQHETSRTVAVVQDGAERTEQGAEIVGRTRAAFERIGVSVNDVHERVSHITGAAERIAGSVTRMEQSIDAIAQLAEDSSATTEQVSAATEETSAQAQEIAASAHDLAQTAGSLEELVAQFRVAESAG